MNYFELFLLRTFINLDMGIDPRNDPRLMELRSGSQTGTTTPDIDRPADGEQPLAEGAAAAATGEGGEEGEEGDGKLLVKHNMFLINQIFSQDLKLVEKVKLKKSKNIKILQSEHLVDQRKN